MDNYDVVGWIILCVILAIGWIAFMILWVFCVNGECNNNCYGQFGVQPGVDANPINRCGLNNNDPCVFAINSITAAEQQCNTLRNICERFTFNIATSTMKIVNNNSTFTSNNSNLFVRQSGLV